MIRIGSLVGNYQVVEKIGEGTMGSVFLASHPAIGKRVALKIIHPHLASNEEIVGRFFTEAKAVAQVNHPHIVDVKDYGQTESGESFIVMELLSGRSLGQEIAAQGTFELERAIHITKQIADGLDVAHAKGVVHRDLKPDNIFLINREHEPDFVKILDFGLAKVQGAMKHKTQTGSLLGTPHYMAPEQAEDTRSADARADIYSLGCIFFELLTGKVPFAGDGFGDVLVRHVREPPPLPTRINPDIPRSIERIVLHALAKKPEFRFPTMRQFREALEHPDRFVEQMDSSDPTTEEMQVPFTDSEELTLPVGATQPVVAGSPSGEVKRVTTQRALRPTLASAQHRSPWLAMGLSVLLAAIVVLAVVTGLHFFKSGQISVTVQTEPAGAELWKAGQKIGRTPLVLRLARGSSPISLIAKKELFADVEKTLTPDHDQALQINLPALLPTANDPPAAQNVEAPRVVPAEPPKRNPHRRNKDADQLLTPRLFQPH